MKTNTISVISVRIRSVFIPTSEDARLKTTKATPTPPEVRASVGACCTAGFDEGPVAASG
jgi:hypothetical protein